MKMMKFPRIPVLLTVLLLISTIPFQSCEPDEDENIDVETEINCFYNDVKHSIATGVTEVIYTRKRTVIIFPKAPNMPALLPLLISMN